MNLSPEIWAIVIQTIVLIGGFVVFMLRREHRITKVEGRVDNLEDAVRPIPGISRHLAELKGRLHKQ
jgi:uncharacterized membrane protein YecN with MAPEG domain